MATIDLHLAYLSLRSDFFKREAHFVAQKLVALKGEGRIYFNVHLFLEREGCRKDRGLASEEAVLLSRSDDSEEGRWISRRSWWSRTIPIT